MLAKRIELGVSMDYDPSPQVPFYSGVVASQGISWMDSLRHFELATGHQAGVGHRYVLYDGTHDFKTKLCLRYLLWNQLTASAVNDLNKICQKH